MYPYPAYQQLSEASDHGQTHGNSYNLKASSATSSADPCQPPPLGVPDGGRRQGQSHYSSYTDSQIPPVSSDMGSPHSVYPPTPGFPRYQSLTSPTYPAGHSPSRGAVPTVAAAQTQYQQSMVMSHASLKRSMSGSRGATQLPYARATPAPPVPHDIPTKTPEPTIKKRKNRKRADARRSEATNKRIYARTAFPSTEERLQLAKDLDMSARSAQIWLAHTFVCTTCMISESSTIFSGSRTRGSRTVRQGGRNPANPGPLVGQVTATLHPEAQNVPVHPRTNQAPMAMSLMGESPYPSRSGSPLQVMMGTGQTRSSPSGGGRADVDSRKHWPGPSRGY